MYRLTTLLLITVTLFGCKKQTEQTSVTDSSSTTVASPTPGGAVDESLQIPSVPEFSRKAKVDSQLKAEADLPESDSMDVRAQIGYKTLAGAETVARGVELFVVSVDKEDSATVVHCVLQNLWGTTTKFHPQPIRVTLTREQIAKAKLLSDQVARTLVADPDRVKGRMEVAQAQSFNLKPGEMRALVLAFPPVPPTSKTATLIIPTFATVSGVPLGN